MQVSPLISETSRQVFLKVYKDCNGHKEWANRITGDSGYTGVQTPAAIQVHPDLSGGAPCDPQCPLWSLFLGLPPNRQRQFFDPQPARKSRTSSPGLKIRAAAALPASAILRLICSKSALTHPTLDTSISPSCATQKMVGTLVSP